MPAPVHSITRQTIAVAVADAGIARALQPALADFNEGMFLPVIERVFDEFGRAGAEVMIDRLTLDLGVVPFDDLPAIAAARLAAALRTELSRLLASEPESGVATLTGEAADLAILEHYLVTGLWPAWSSRPAAIDLDRLIEDIAAAQPADLGALLYRIGTAGGVLERLVAQLDEATLERLVAVLEPAHAALIVGVIAETRAAHKEEPVTDMSETAFADRVWLMTLNYLVAEPGTQFNRREFVRSLLHGMAGETGADYSEILATFRKALNRVAGRRPLHSSLPAILLDLAKEDDAERPASPAPGTAERILVDADAAFRRYDATVTPEKPASDLSESQSAEQDIASHARLKTALAFALAKLDEPAIERLLRALMPHAMKEGLPFVESLRHHAGAAADRGAFYAGVILAALEDTSLALDDLARETIDTSTASARPGAGTSAAIRKLRRALEKARRGQEFDAATVSSLRDAVAQTDGTIRRDAAAGRPVDARPHHLIDALEELFAELPDHLRPAADRLADALAHVNDRWPQHAESGLAVLFIQDAFDGAVPPQTIAELRRRVETRDRLRPFSESTRASLRAALARVAGDTSMRILSKRRGSRAAVLAVLAAALQSLPANVRPSRERIDAVLTADVRARRTLDVATVARLLRDSVGTVTPEIAEAMYGSLSEFDRRKLQSVRSRDVVRVAVVEVVRQEGVVAIDPRDALPGTIVMTVATLLHAMPPEDVLPAEHVAAVLMAASGSPGGRWNDAAFIAKLIRDNLTGPLSPALVDSLARSLESADFAEMVDPKRRGLFRAAIDQLGKDMERNAGPRQPSRSRPKDTILRAAAEEFLASGRVSRRGGMESGNGWLADAVHDLLMAEPGKAVAIIRAGAVRRRTVTAWSRRLSPPLLARLAAIIEPRRHRLLVETVERLGTLLSDELAAAGKAAYRARDRWAFVLDYAARHADKAWRPRDVSAAFIRREIVPRFGTSAAFEKRIAEAPGGGFLREPAGGEIDLVPSFPRWTTTDLPGLLRDDTPDSRRRALGLLRAGLADRNRRAAVARTLSAEDFDAALRLLQPRRLRLMRDVSALLFTALAAADKRAIAPFGGTSALRWFLLDFAAHHRGRKWSAETLVRLFFQQVAVAHARRLSGSAGEIFLRKLVAQVERHAGTAGLRMIAQAIVADRDSREAMAAALSLAQFDSVLRALEPRRHKLLRDMGAVLFSALAVVDKNATGRFGGTPALRRFLLGFITAHRGKSWSAEALILMFFREIAAAQARCLGSVAGEAFPQALIDAIDAQARTAGLRGLVQVMRRLRPTLIASARKAEPERAAEPGTVADVSNAALKPRAGLPIRARAEHQKAARAPIYIDNAGLVLAGPFIPHLFRSLGMLEQTESGSVKLATHDAATRAVHLLQYLVTSRAATPEPLLILNKILAGIPLGAVVGAGIEMTEEESGLCDKLLGSMLANWPALSTGTSVAGLQSAFMQREGRLTLEDDKWKLKVERKTLDVLVDQVPWGFRLIYAAWMPQPLHVEW